MKPTDGRRQIEISLKLAMASLERAGAHLERPANETDPKIAEEYLNTALRKCAAAKDQAAMKAAGIANHFSASHNGRRSKLVLVMSDRLKT